MTNSVGDIEEADCILIIGSDTTSQHPLIARRVVIAKERGATVIVVDPRRVQIARLADMHLQLRPGTNIALLNAMMKVILDAGLEDKPFIEERTEGFAELQEALQSVSLEEAAAVTGIPQETIEQAALAYAKADRASILYCMGITQHTTGVNGVLTVANLAMLTGNIGKPGTGVNPLRGQNNVQGACDMGGLPNVFPGYQPVINETVSASFAEAWGVAALSPTVGLTITEMTDAAINGTLKAMYVVGENPIISDPDMQHTRHGFESLDFLVVQDIFMTETAQCADVVLPSACWAEKVGTFSNTERRVQMVRKAVDPPGEAKPDSEIICAVAKAMGARGFDFAGAQDIFEEIRSVTPQYAGITYARIDTPESVQWPCPNEDHPGTPVLHGQKFARGQGKFSPVVYQPSAEVPDAEYPLVLTTGRIMFQYHTGTMTRRSPALETEAPEAFVEINPEDARQLGITQDRYARVSSRRGSITIKVKVTDAIKHGIVYIPFHFVEAAANMLTNPAVDPVAKIPEYKVCAVNVTPISAQAERR